MKNLINSRDISLTRVDNKYYIKIAHKPTHIQIDFFELVGTFGGMNVLFHIPNHWIPPQYVF